MLSRWYSILLGFLLLVLGIAGLVGAGIIGGTQSGLIITSIIWLIIAVASLWVGYGVRNPVTVRWYSGVLGGLLFLWGVIQLFSAPVATAAAGFAVMTASIAGFLVFLGAIGLAAASVPAVWLEHRPTEAM